MKALTDLILRFRDRNNPPKRPSQAVDDIDRLMKSVVGVMDCYHGHLNNLAALEISANSVAEASRLQEQIDSAVNQAVDEVSAALRQWADWLGDPSRPMPPNSVPTSQSDAEDDRSCQ